MLEPGTFIGDYEIIAPLKSGGMATLFIARRVGPGGFVRPVAIKLVHQHLVRNDEFIQMFLDEARICARIEHPNVVHVEDLGQHEGNYFLAMEYVHGCSLSQFLRGMVAIRRALSPELAVNITAAIADALHAAHETRDAEGQLLHVVHRDVTPQNIMISFAGHIKLIDFGVAKARGRINETRAGFIKGKLRYMSPEQAWGKPIDRRADIYALGVVLWEMLTQRRYIPKGNDIELIKRAREPEWSPPSRYRPQVTPELDQVVKMAMEVEPGDRFNTAQEFRRALANASARSFEIDSGDVSSLLHAVLKDSIAEQNEKLPDNVTQVVQLPLDDGDGVVDIELLAGDFTGEDMDAVDEVRNEPPSNEFEAVVMTIPDSPVMTSALSSRSRVPKVASLGGSGSVQVGEIEPTVPESTKPVAIRHVVPKTLVAALLSLTALAGLGIPAAYRMGKEVSLPAQVGGQASPATDVLPQETVEEPGLVEPPADASVPQPPDAASPLQEDAMVTGVAMPVEARPVPPPRSPPHRGGATMMRSVSEIPF